MKKLFTLFLSLTMVFTLAACGSSEAATTDGGSGSESTEWAIYWYLCGSDLETNYGAATNDLDEMLEVQLPENVKVVIQTGGANTWQNEIVSADKLQRYVYDKEGLKLVEEVQSASMGDPQTLTDFLTFAKKNYPAKRTMVTFWNHGGGSVAGAAFDELYAMDSLTLSELYQAFTSVYEENAENQPVDIIGFDTCLMATVDTAYTFSDLGKYLVASEELEPGNGWFYSGFIGDLASNPTMEPIELAKAVCDSYLEGCELVGTEESITLSVTNLSKVNALVSAYDNFGKEALASAVESPSFFAHFSRIAGSIENYGSNTREQGFTNMADLGHLARGSAELLPEAAEQVLTALEDCVEYKVNGKYRQESTGLSCYYSYNGDVDDFQAYTQIGPSEGFKYFYHYGLTGELSQEGMDYLAELNYERLPELLTLSSVDWEDAPVTVDQDGIANLTLGKEAYDILSSIPILLNGEDYNLSVVYDFTEEEYYIVGTRKSLDDSGAADKNLRYLVEGDEIQTIHYANILSEENDELTPVPIDTIVVTPETAFAEIELGDGLFIMIYEMKDSQGNVAYSVPITLRGKELRRY